MEWVLEYQAVDGNFSNKIFFSDEAHFALVGYVNKQNCRIWGSENPQIIEERPLHKKKSLLVCSLVRRCDSNLLIRNRRWNDCHRQFGELWSYVN